MPIRRAARSRVRRFGLSLALTAGLLSAAPSTLTFAEPAAPAESDSTSVVGLGPGSRGGGVRAVQEKLLSFGYHLRGGADGIFGPSTESTLKVFQRQNGLDPTGVVTETTAKYLGLSSGVAARSSRSSAGSAPAPNSASNSSARSSGVGLRRGMTGESVRQLQLAILGTGMHLNGGADGTFGPSTERGVTLVQRVNGLPETGVVDDATARALGLTGNASSRSTPAPAGTIAYGATGADVRRVQQLLIKAGVDVPGGADGVFGPMTRQSVRSFQQRHGLPVTGAVDAATDTAIARAAGANSSSSGNSNSSQQSSSQYVGLRVGSSGGAVTRLQQAIMATGMTLRGGADGVFGPVTERALKRYQDFQGLDPTGVVDEATARMLGLTSGSSGSSGGRRGAGGGGGGGSSTNGASSSTPSGAPGATVRLQAKPLASGPCWYGDTWRSPRGGGRVHLGVDIGAPAGTPLRAVASGRITQIYRNQSRAGNGLNLTTSDGTYFFYAHLQGFAPGIGVGVPVKAGQVIGYMGRSGNAGMTHLHLEVHPRGGSAINPYPLVKAIGAC